MSSHPSRRTILQAAAAAPLAAAAEPQRTRPAGSLTDVPGLKVGHWTSDRRPTGCTVVLADAGAVAGVDVRGGGPGTRETDLLRPERTVEKAHGIALAGGSAYGLAAADGVMQFLEEKGVGFRAGRNVVPIVPAAILFDLQLGDGSIRPDKHSGYLAAKAATTERVEQGNVGAGAGATVGKLLGPLRSMKGGLGSASLRLPGGIVVGAIAAVNSLGDIVDPETGELLAGALTEDGKSLANTSSLIRSGLGFGGAGGFENTTLVVVGANVDWTQAQATKVAQMAQDGLARAIRPVHMPFDGDTVFTLGTGGAELDDSKLGLLGAIAADVVGQAIVSAILHGESIADRVSRSELLAEKP